MTWLFQALLSNQLGRFVGLAELACLRLEDMFDSFECECALTHHSTGIPSAYGGRPDQSYCAALCQL